MLPAWYNSARKKVESLFTPENKLDECSEHLSPCGRYKLLIQNYKVESNGSNYTRGIVINLSTEQVIADIKRSDDEFWFCWLVTKKILLCAEDPCGYSIVNLKTETTLTYIDPKARSGMAFEWKSVKPNCKENLLAVTGTYMGTIRTVIIYSIEKEIVPLPVVKSLDNKILGNFKVKWHKEKTLKVRIAKKTLNIKIKDQ